jgi:hypothetical protein
VRGLFPNGFRGRFFLRVFLTLLVRLSISSGYEHYRLSRNHFNTRGLAAESIFVKIEFRDISLLILVREP